MMKIIQGGCYHSRPPRIDDVPRKYVIISIVVFIIVAILVFLHIR